MRALSVLVICGLLVACQRSLEVSGLVQNPKMYAIEDLLRAFPLENSDPPATIFRVYRRPPEAAKPGPRAGKR